jgi:hypothetical protein
MDEASIQALMLAIPGLTREQATALLGTGGGTSSVYFGGSIPTTKVAGRPGKPVTVVTGTQENTLTTEEAYLKFWKDPATKAKVMARLKLMGREELGEAGGYSLWKDTVDQSAEIYSSGKGYKITPFELLNLSAKQAAPAPSSRQVYNYKPEEIKALINDVYINTLGRSATEEEKAARFATLDKQIQEGTTTTSKVVKNPTTGKMETLTTSTPAFSQQAAKTSIEEELKKANPDDFDRKTRIDFATFLTKNVAGA